MIWWILGSVVLAGLIFLVIANSLYRRDLDRRRLIVHAMQRRLGLRS